MDVARDGHPDAGSLLIVSSACHGVEGFCGSGVQVSALHDAEWREHARAAGVAVLYVHALNPYGFSHIRRVTHENVDLNRNFHDFSQAAAGQRGLPRAACRCCCPRNGRRRRPTQRPSRSYIATHGEAAFQAAITRGQYEFPDGLFFGGTAPTWSNLALREVLRAHGTARRRASPGSTSTPGLGPSGVGERIFAGRDDAAAVARARAWWGGEGATPVTSIYDGSSTSAFLTGLMWSAVYEECPQAEYTGIALEYGTVPVLETLQALRAEHWLHVHPQAPRRHWRRGIKQQMKDAFYTDTDEWKDQVLRQAREALFQAVDGLAG